MESNGASASNVSGYSSRKRRISVSRQFSGDQYEHQGEGALHSLESPEKDLSQRLQRVEWENQSLKSQVQTLQQQYEQVSSYNRDLASRMKELEDRFEHPQTTHGVESRGNNHSQRSSRQIGSNSSSIDQLIKDFGERFELVESDNQTLTERLDSCQQNFSKIRTKNETIENQLISLQQRFNNVEVNDTDMQQTETISTQQTSSTVSDENDGCDLVEKALCAPHEKEIELLTADVQYGTFGICEKYSVILLKEQDKLKLFDGQKQIEARPWALFGTSNYVTCIHWCSFLESFLILYRFGLHTLPLKVNPATSQVRLGELKEISSVRAYSLKHDRTNEKDAIKEILRFITTSAHLPGFMYLNRGYRQIQLINTSSWKVTRGWSKIDLEYGERDHMKTIEFSNDGTYIAMNIDWNERLKFIDLRKHDDQLSLMKRIRTPDDSLSLSFGAQLPIGSQKWIVIDDRNQCYKVSENPNDETIKPIQTGRLSDLGNVKIRLRFINNYVLVGALIGDHRKSQGVFRFYRIPA